MTVSAGIRRVIGARATMSVAATAMVCAVAAGAYVLADPPRPTRTYCAMMPDAVGLYVGNRVTIRGIRVGDVTRIDPDGERVRVEFTVDAAERIGADAGATTVSRGVVADRELAVIDDGRSAATLEPNRCLTKTLTPKSISRSMQALARLADEILAPGADEQALHRFVAAVDASVAGTGPRMNDLTRRLASALRTPDSALVHLAGVLDSLAAVSAPIAEHWGDIEAMLTRLADVLDQVDSELFTETVSIIDGFRRVLPMINDITTMFGGPILTVLNATVPLTHFIGANVAVLSRILAMIPPLLDAFRSVVDPRTDQPGLQYRPPRAAVPSADAGALCAAVNAVAAGRCHGADGGLADIDLTQLVLGMVAR